MTTTDTTTATPNVWVGCLGCYNAGNLIGKWVDATDAAGLTWRDIGCPPPDIYDSHEELWVMDHEGFGGLLTGECSPMEATRLAELIADITDRGYELGAVAAYFAHLAEEPTDDLAGFDDAYRGEWESDVEYAQQYAEDVGAIDDDACWPADHIDWEAAAAELMQDYWTEDAPGGGVYVFRYC